MAFPYGPEDVRKHLEDLGYEDISPEQLTEFIKDLKRLIRYEEKQKRLQEHIGILDMKDQDQDHKHQKRHHHHHRGRRRSHSTSSSSAYSSSSSQFDDETATTKHTRHHHLRHQRKDHKGASQQVILDRSFSRGQQSSYTSAQSTTSSSKSSCSSSRSCSSSLTSSRSATSSSCSSSSRLVVQIQIPPERAQSLSSLRHLDEVVDGGGRLLRRSQRSGLIPNAKPTTSFIRPPMLSKSKKQQLSSDPVRLHQQYKAYWDKMKIPGDNTNCEIIYNFISTKHRFSIY